MKPNLIPIKKNHMQQARFIKEKRRKIVLINKVSIFMICFIFTYTFNFGLKNPEICVTIRWNYIYNT